MRLICMDFKEYYLMNCLICLPKELIREEEDIEEKDIEEICDRIDKILKKEVKNDE